MHLQPACPSSCTSLSLARARYLARAVQVARTVPGSTQVHLGHGYGCSHTARQRARAALAQRLENAISKCLSAAVAVSLLLGQPAAQAEDVTITYPASPDPAIRAAQQTLVESWAYVSAYYVDHNFNGTDWKQLAQDTLASSFKASAPVEVYDQLDTLLGRLEDPFTRLLRQDDTAAFVAQEEGKVLSTGLGLLPDASGQLRVSYLVEGSPAAAAGDIHPGDVLLSVNSQPVTGKPLSEVYKLLRQDAALQFQRPSDAAAGIPGQSNGLSSSSSGRGVEQLVEVHLAPVPLEFQPVQFALLDSSKLEAAITASTRADNSIAPPVADMGNTAAGSSSSSGGGSSSSSRRPVIYLQAASVSSTQAPAAAADSITATPSSSSSSSSQETMSCPADGPCIGYLRIAAFSQTTPELVSDALTQLERGGMRALVLDLRDNAGGLVAAGLEVVEDFLRQGQVLCQAVGRDGNLEVVTLPEAHPLTSKPLVVLVNGRTASTSELLAGALHDEYPALLLGERTYGKGRTQRVLPLQSGDTLLVSTAQYSTPRGAPVDKVGLQPDVACVPEEVVGEQWQAGEVGPGSLLDDPCIVEAARRLAAGAGAQAAT